MNEQYSKLIGRDFAPDGQESVKLMVDRIKPREYKDFSELFTSAYHAPLTGVKDILEFTREDGEVINLQIRLFFLRKRPDVRVYYASVMKI